MLVKGALETKGGVHLLGGYPGSPIAGFFDSMSRIKDLLNDKGNTISMTLLGPTGQILIDKDNDDA